MTLEQQLVPSPTEAAARVSATIAGIHPTDATTRAAAYAHLDGLVKPIGSLGRLEELAATVAGIRRTTSVPAPTPAVVVCAADHGVTAEAVSAYPQSVTGLMLLAFASGDAAVGVLSRQVGARLVVADLGVVDPPPVPELLNRSVRAGTGNSARDAAMTSGEAHQALAVGIDLANGLIDDGIDLIALGEMGIGNTTTASALTAALLGKDPATVCGPGTGLDSEQLRHKVEVVTRVLERHADAGQDPLELLARMGGLEVGALAGVVLGCAARGIPVLVDGFITGAAALLAARLAPVSAQCLIASHLSPEPGHALQLADLGLVPLLDLGMRLGEGSGATLAIPVVRAALAILTEMAGFDRLGLDSDRPLA